MKKLRKVREVLIVEDNPADVQLIEVAFKTLESKVNLSVARDGEEALDFLMRRGRFTEALTPHLILLDCSLPKLDGRELLKIIKQDETLKRIPVVILTTSRNETDVRECYAAHANGYVVKQDDIDSIIELGKAIDLFWLQTNWTAPRTSSKPAIPGRPAPDGSGTSGTR